MSTTFLLLRNNKQTGPHTLNTLLTLNLQPHDLVWVEGESAGWRYPAEVPQLKNELNPQIFKPDASNVRIEVKPLPAQNASPKNRSNKASHIYVSLPAGSIKENDVEPTIPVPDLEAKAEALYQRTQAYLASHKEDDPEVRYSRSLSDMKDAYGSWLIHQKQKQKNGRKQRVVLISLGCALLVLASYFSYRVFTSAEANRVLSPSITAENTKVDQTITAQPSSPSYASKIMAPVTETEVNMDSAILIKQVKAATLRGISNKPKKSKVKHTDSLASRSDSTSAGIVLTSPETTPVPLNNSAIKVLPLSRLVSVSGQLVAAGFGKNAEIYLQNNSTERLKSISVIVSFYRKNEKELSRETVNFYNVMPGTKSEVQTNSNRRASSIRLQVVTITRADGSLYLVH